MPHEIKIGDAGFWQKVDQLIALVNVSTSISLDKVLEIFPGIGDNCLDEIRTKRPSPLLLEDGYFEQKGEPIQCDFQVSMLNIRVKINKELMGTYHKSQHGFRLKFHNIPRTIEILRPWGSRLEVLDVRKNEIFIDNSGGILDIVVTK